MDFKAEINIDSSLCVNLTEVSLGKTSITTQYTITQNGALCSIFKVVQVAVESQEDGKLAKKAVPVPVRELLEGIKNKLLG